MRRVSYFYRRRNNRELRYILLCLFFQSFYLLAHAQRISVKGVVRDILGETVLGVNIVEKGTTNGTITDMDGRFTIDVASPNATLSISYIGYVSKDVPLNGQTEVSIVIEEDVYKLDEVVAIGYGTIKKQDLTGSVASVAGTMTMPEFTLHSYLLVPNSLHNPLLYFLDSFTVTSNYPV